MEVWEGEGCGGGGGRDDRESFGEPAEVEWIGIGRGGRSTWSVVVVGKGSLGICIKRVDDGSTSRRSHGGRGLRRGGGHGGRRCRRGRRRVALIPRRQE